MHHHPHYLDEFKDIPTPTTLLGHLKLHIWKTLKILTHSTETLDDMVYMGGETVLSPFAVGLYGILKRVALFGVFIALFASNFITLNITQKFVALSKTAGNCEEIPKSWTISILADRNGYWSGQEGFMSNEASYQFILFNFEENI